MCKLSRAVMFMSVWLIIVLYGYSYGADCSECTYCTTYEQVNFQPASISCGYTDAGTNTPWIPQAFNGTGNGGSTDFTASSCDDYSANYANPVVEITVWQFSSKTNSCTIIPPAPASYNMPIFNGANQSAWYIGKWKVCSLSE